jgi:hypothetical protein
MERHAELVAPCGMNCGVCSSYLAGTRTIKNLGVGMPYCRGCRPGNKSCAFLKKKCRLLTEGTVKFCYECPGFPCDRLVALDKRYRERYHMSMLGNLAFIKDKGTDAFLQKEKEKWQCPGCGGTISCHNGICFDCGIERLRERAVKKTGLYRWEEEKREVG